MELQENIFFMQSVIFKEGNDPLLSTPPKTEVVFKEGMVLKDGNSRQRGMAFKEGNGPQRRE